MTKITDKRPLMTMALLAYNQERYIREAVEGILSQTYEPLEFILSDDCSTDQTFEIMQELVLNYAGTNKITLRRNETNLGLIGHVNKIFEISRGEYIIAAAGDDISSPDRAERVAQVIKESAPLLIHSDCIFIDEEGNRIPNAPITATFSHSTDVFSAATSRALYVGATGVWHKDLVRKYGAIQCPGAYEDLVMGYRAALEGRIAHIAKPVVQYRYGVGISTKFSLTRKSANEANARTADARSASLKQRLIDTRTKASPLTESLSKVIKREIDVEDAISVFYRAPFKFFLVRIWNRNVLAKFSTAAFRKVAASFAK